jgi:hypothetical protein
MYVLPPQRSSRLYSSVRWKDNVDQMGFLYSSNCRKFGLPSLILETREAVLFWQEYCKLKMEILFFSALIYS